MKILLLGYGKKNSGPKGNPSNIYSFTKIDEGNSPSFMTYKGKTKDGVEVFLTNCEGASFNEKDETELDAEHPNYFLKKYESMFEKNTVVIWMTGSENPLGLKGEYEAFYYIKRFMENLMVREGNPHIVSLMFYSCKIRNNMKFLDTVPNSDNIPILFYDRELRLKPMYNLVKSIEQPCILTSYYYRVFKILNDTKNTFSQECDSFIVDLTSEEENLKFQSLSISKRITAVEQVNELIRFFTLSPEKMIRLLKYRVDDEFDTTSEEMLLEEEKIFTLNIQTIMWATYINNKNGQFPNMSLMSILHKDTFRDDFAV